MKIIITYELPTANGSWVTHQIDAKSLEEADRICKAIDWIGYILKDVTRDVYAE